MGEINEEVKAHFEALRKHYDKVYTVFIKSEAELSDAPDKGGKDAERKRREGADRADQDS